MSAARDQDTLIQPLLDSIGVGVWRYDHRTGQTDWSVGLRDMLGYDLSGKQGLSAWLERIHPDDRPGVEARVRAALEQDGRYEAEYRIVHAGGGWLWVKARGRVVESEADGAPRVTAGVMIDVTRQRVDRQMLRLQQIFTRTLADHATRESLFPAILNVFLETPGLDGAGIYWRDADGGFRLAQTRGLSERFVAQVAYVPADSHRAARVREGRTICSSLEDAPTCNDHELIGLDHVREEGICTLIVLPIRVDGEAAACVNLASRQVTSVREETLDFLDSLARQFGSGLEALRVRERADAEHREAIRSAAMLRAERDLFTGGPVAVLVWRVADGWPLEYVSPNAVEVFGRDSESLRAPGFRYADCILAEDLPHVAAEVKGYLEDPRRMTWEQRYRIVRPDGSTRNLYDFTVAERDAAGTAVRLRGYVTDETALHQMNRELTRTREQLDLALLGAGLGVWDWNITTGEAYFSPIWKSMLGYAPEAFLASHASWESHLHPEDLPRVRAEVLAQFGDAAKDYVVEFRMRHKLGHWVWIQSRGRVVERDGAGKPLRMTGVHLDISERKRVDEELQRVRQQLEQRVAERTAELSVARDQAEAANRAKSTFLANMSHEIRTPMHAILGLAHLLQRDVPDGPARVRLERLQGAAQHLLSVIGDILDLSRIEVGKVVLGHHDFDARAVCERVLDQVAPAAEAKGLRLALEFDPAIPALRGDEVRLAQALLNYAGNAVKFTEHGSVTLAARLLACEASRVRLRFEVRDTGAGVEARDRERLFDAFEQGDTSSTRTHGGSGLGLAIAREIARLMEGEAGVDSTPGAGSTFWMEILIARGATGPLPSRNDAVGGDPRAIPLFREGTRVLVAEDNAINIEVMTELLNETGVRIDVAHDGAEAVERVAAHAYDLVLMDVHMPRLDGLEAARAIRHVPGRAEVPIIALTANAFTEARDECLAAGMNDYLSKPVAPEHLYAMLIRWLPHALGPNSAEGASPGTAFAPPRADYHAIDGLDAASGLAICGGDAANYRKWLAAFVQHHAGDMHAIARHVDAGDRVATHRLAHALKGVAATLGMTRLCERARILEHALSDTASCERETLDTRLRDTGAELDRMVAALSERRPDQGSTA